MKHTGQAEDVIERDTERDFWMDAKAAVAYGLVDEVLEAQSKEDEDE
jgi:ATP-dependent Clp protease protease subunit